MKNLITTLAIAALILSAGCKDKPQNKAQRPVKKEVMQKEVKKDTSAVDTLMNEPVVKEVETPKPEDKYFLIAGSFENRNYADDFKSQLEADGYNSRVIERPAGPNGEFYKVSYQSFYDKEEAFSELNTARNVEGRDDVWLLIKR